MASNIIFTGSAKKESLKIVCILCLGLARVARAAASCEAPVRLSVIAENCCNGDQTLCKSFFACFACPSGFSPWPFLFAFHIVCFLAPQLLTASWTMPFHTSVCALHFHFTFGAAYLLGLSLHVLYIFIKLAPAACIWTTLLAFPTYRWLERATPALGHGCCLLPGWFPCCLACHGRCLAYCTCLASVE